MIMDSYSQSSGQGHDRAKFAAAMAPANSFFAQQFGGDLIEQIRDHR
jgi:hypothetical protein